MATTFRVVTYNIHGGLSAFRRADVIQRIAEALVASRADVVLLQEVWGYHGKRVFQLERLSREVWWHRAFGRNVVFDNGYQGNAILSRFPIVKSKNIDISVEGVEPRGCLTAEIAVPPTGRRVAVLSQHLGLSEAEREAQINRLIDFLPREIERDWPLVMGGDFNDWRGRVSAVLERKLGIVDAHWTLTKKHARTYPSICPFIALDRIYARNLIVRSTRVHREARFRGLSDHLPFEAEFELQPRRRRR